MMINKHCKIEIIVPKEKWGNLYIASQDGPDDQVVVTIAGKTEPGMLASLADTIQVWCAEEED